MVLDDGSPEAGGPGPAPVVGLFALVPPEAVVVETAEAAVVAAAVVVVVIVAGGAPAPETVGEEDWWVVGRCIFFVTLREMSEPFDFVEEEERTRFGDGSRAQRSLTALDLVLPRESLGCLKSVEVGGGGEDTGTDPVEGRGTRMGNVGGEGAEVSIASGIAGLVRSISSLKMSEALIGTAGSGAAASLGGLTLGSLIRLKRKLS